tara:strand:- start:747 stop:1886 length:1140 start_codon:yes stop_codon:yes gene_type:complete
MKLSDRFENLILKQLESFGSFMGVQHLVVYLASPKDDAKAKFEIIGQWPQINKLLMPIDDDPELKASSPNRRWYPLQDKDILIGVLRVETDFDDGEWPFLLDSRLKALSISLSTSFSIELERQRNDEEINYFRNQIGTIIHQLRNPLAALTTYAKLLIKRLGTDTNSVEIVQSMLIEQNQINEYVSSFEKIAKSSITNLDFGEERLLLPPDLDHSKRITVQTLLNPIIERGKANSKLLKRTWIQPVSWPDWTRIEIPPSFRVIGEIVANLLENAFKYSPEKSEVGIIAIDSGLLVFDNGDKIANGEQDKIFQKGFRGFASKNKEGSGVGLYLARKLARKMGGELTLVNDDNSYISNKDLLDCNATNIFYLKLPIKELRL